MAQRLKKSSLFFGQLAGGKQPQQYGDTLSGFYGGVGAGQTGAVQTLGQQVQEKTKGLAGTLGLEQKVDETEPTKITTGLAAGSKFTPTVDTSKPIPSVTPGGAATQLPATTVTVPQKKEGMSDEEYLKTLSDEFTKAGSSVEEWKASGKSAEDYLRQVLSEKQKAAGEAATEAQEQVTEKKLGARREASELEKQASSYQNVLASEPGTTNIGALASLSKFFDPKYAALESGLKQGEISLARQQAVGNVTAQQQAEQARAAAIGEYSKQAKELGQTLQERVGEAGEAESKRLAAYYGGGQSAAEKTKTDIEGKITKTKGDIEARITNEMNTEYKKASEDKGLEGLSSILDAIKGRSGNNWLNVRGSERLAPLKTKMEGLRDQIDQIKNSVLYTPQEKTTKLRELNSGINQIKSQAAGELAAFLGDTNTQPGDALDSAEQIMAAGLINNLNDNQRQVILQRIENDLHTQGSNRNQVYGSIDKLERIYRAFGGTKDIRGLATRKLDREYNSDSGE